MGKWLNDHIQLCAQAMCLEEHFSHIVASSKSRVVAERKIQYGFIFYFGSRHRERVEFDETLRAKTVESIQRIWILLRQSKMPMPIERYAKCRECSLEPICLPREVRQLVGDTGLQRG
jgi:CRISPR-associated exonuclease Cas4